MAGRCSGCGWILSRDPYRTTGTVPSPDALENAQIPGAVLSAAPVVETLPEPVPVIPSSGTMLDGHGVSVVDAAGAPS
jgi:hypothetical protein